MEVTGKGHRGLGSGLDCADRLRGSSAVLRQPWSWTGGGRPVSTVLRGTSVRSEWSQWDAGAAEPLGVGMTLRAQVVGMERRSSV